jgi:polyribonucleotide nucleotidyltransferase
VIPVKKTFQYGDHTVTLETGRIARQASGAVMVNMSDTVVLVTVVGKKDPGQARDFLPLTVNYQERTYAAGKIPGGFFKREGRPSEKETLVSRLIDRPIRPLFPNGFTNEVQIIATVISMNNQVDADIPALIGASAALAVSGIPFDGPLGAARIGYHNGEFILNPTFGQLDTSELDLVVAGTADAVLMVESEANCLSEQTMLDAVIFGHEQMQTVIQVIGELAQEAGKPRWDWEPVQKDERLAQALAEIAEGPLGEAYRIAEKQERLDRVSAIRDEVMARLLASEETAEGWGESEIAAAFKGLEKKIVRGCILRGEPRIDGRDSKTVRPISIEVATLPRTHGSAIFTRGETQAIVVTT